MKKIFIYGAAALAGIFSLTNCTKEAAIETPAAGVPFEIYAGSAEVTTKTTIDGFSTSWAAKDSINLFHAVSGTTTYQNDGKFTVADPASGKFTGTLAAALESGENYDWYALYPYDSRIATPASRTKGYSVIGCDYKSTQTQTGANSTAHLAGYNYPLYGKSSAPTAGAETPSITLKPAFSVVEIEVKNSTANDLPVSNITFTAPEAIIGTFYIDFSGATPTYTPSGDIYAISTASLSVTGDATIAANASAKFYLAVKPFTAASGSTLKISVNGYEKSLKLTSDATFTAGKIKTLSFNYDKTNETWTLVAPTQKMVDGVYIILAKHEEDTAYGFLPNTKASSSGPVYSSQSYFDGSTASYTIKGVSDIMRWSFSKNSDGSWTIKNAEGNRLYGTSDNNGVRVNNNETGSWTITAHEKNSAAFSFKNNIDRYLCVFDRKDWRSYKSTSTSSFGTNGQNSQIILYYLGELTTAPAAPVINVTSDNPMSITNAGGLLTLDYTISNPVTGAKISATSSESWITNISTSTSGKVTFSVTAQASGAASRSGSITLSYPDADNVIVTVNQVAGAGAVANEYTLTITPSDFTSKSYADNNKSHTSTAVGTSDSSLSFDVSWTSNQVMEQTNVIQFKKQEGYIYNTTDLGTIKSVTVNCTAGSFTTYYGTSEKPESGVNVGNGFFNIKSGSSTSKASSIVIKFEK